MENGLFPVLPEDLKALSDDEIQELLDTHVSAAALIDADDTEFLAGLDGEDIISQYTVGKDQILTLRAEQKERAAAFEAFQAEKAKIKAELEPQEETEQADPGDETDVVAEPEVVAEVEPEVTEPEPAEVVEEKVPVTASAPRFARTPPRPAPAREPEPETKPVGAALVATGEMAYKYKETLSPKSLGDLVLDFAKSYGPHAKVDAPGKYRFGGPEVKVASATFGFPEERELTGDIESDTDKILNQLPRASTSLGRAEADALTASGGICAPATPLYTLVNFGVEDEPVWDSLPVFRAARGAVNVPTSTYIADITTAISEITADEDAQGGTFATKSCQDLSCPAYTETAVQIIAHCREYGNLNARTWPELIAHENALTMQAVARTSEDYLLNAIKALSVNVTNGVETLGALIYLVDAIVKAKWGISTRFRMGRNARFTALLPAYTLDLLLLDTIQTQFDRYRTRGDIDAYLRSTGIDPVYYIDGNFAAGDDQVADAAQTAGAIDGFPNTVQWGLYPQGAFMGIDSGSLELGIVRDSTLNSTNDFQVFGERFRNVARLAPAQAAYWVTTDWCPSGQFPPAGTARTCE